MDDKVAKLSKGLKDFNGLVDEWKKNPQSIFGWRTETFHLIMATLRSEYIDERPKGAQGHGNQLTAMKMMIQIGEALEKIRPEVPHTCPSCGNKFTE